MERGSVEEFSQLGSPEPSGERNGPVAVNGSARSRLYETLRAGGELLP